MNATSWRTLLLVGALAGLSAGASDAKDPDRPPRADRPDRPPAMDHRPDGSVRNRMEWWRERGNQINASEPVTAEEKQQIAEFMTKYSPKRWVRVQDVPDEIKRSRINDLIAMRWRTLERLKKDEPRVYDIRLKRLLIEDEIFDLGWELTHPDSDTKVDEIRSKLREQVKSLVNSGLEERKLRIEQIQERLELDKSRLKEDEAGRDAMIDKQMTQIENERWPMMGDLLPPRGLRGGGPGGPGRPDRPPGPSTAPTSRSNSDEQ